MQNLSNQQRLHLVNTRQLYESYLSALRHLEGYRYALRWKTVRGVDYLFRPSSRAGDGRSFGRRSPELETVLALFEQGRADALAREATLRAKLEEQQRDVEGVIPLGELEQMDPPGVNGARSH